ncbi:MAG TPA: hypothetical protein PK185_00240 [Cyclobacteriaceae bacterium]|nr:hypothetical protein [Cyclobacteriaceae bacterium]HRK52313.1 hypothetical protein [Cyclobacteriaceae bacterium]
MNKIKYLALTLAGIFLLSVSCSDDKELIPVWESGVNGEGKIVSTAQDFKRGDASITLDFQLKWISIDQKATVTKMEVFLTWEETYTDVDGNPAVADHGTKPLISYEGGAVPANRTAAEFSLTQAQVKALYSGATFDYNDGVSGNAIDVFAAPFNPARDATNIFIDKDVFTVVWHFTTDDGRVFDSWSPSVCTEVPGSNCEVQFGVVCAEEISNPGANGGNWTIDMQDTYGDGWQGGYISVKIDGVETKVFIPTQYLPPPEGSGGVPIGAMQTVINVPPTAVTLTFAWSDDDYNSECVFSIKSPKGNVVANVSTPSAGPIKLNLCQE